MELQKRQFIWRSSFQNSHTYVQGLPSLKLGRQFPVSQDMNEAASVGLQEVVC
jgi:hypothetical protein